MAELGDIVVRIRGDEKDLKRAVFASKVALGKLNKSLSQVSGKLGKYTGLTIAAAKATSILFIRSQLNAIDALAKTADGLGITTEKLQALQHVGQLTGSTNEEVNKSLARMERRLMRS